jgi:hypothetical protein
MSPTAWICSTSETIVSNRMGCGVSEQWQCLYGSADGMRWRVTVGPYGQAPDSEASGLPLLGDTTEVLRSVLSFRVQVARGATMTMAREVHDRLAVELGISRGQLRSFVNAEALPELTSAGWGRLAKAYHFISVPAA